MPMNKMEQALGKAVYDVIMAKAQGFNFVDKMVLMNALSTTAEWRTIPETQQRLFVEVGMAAVRALQVMSATGSA